MKKYVVKTKGFTHYIVAESIRDAKKTFHKYHSGTIKSIRLIRKKK